MKLIFATNNQNKVKEFRSLVGNQFEIITLQEAGIDIDIPEPHDTLEANATEKSSTIHRMTNENCFAEDTGLEISALNGAPGVLSARYAGEQKEPADNIAKVLREMEGKSDRQAQFRTVISLILDNKEYQFEGVCEGTISTSIHGSKGFGYDPIFIPTGATRSFAEMDMAEKNQYSHRAKAFQAFAAFLQSYNEQQK
ncbi:XTP/dITP diphosphohydrolase [Chitinophaga terrae (ex Kim and Jung 2007)]|uniref:dITP/XTP pyrophosphatase n=1 Tax=Chitinophaga terrae (ex Kim and Jung 2007) TaxID=408074 RepID=A0A1H4AC94_9BACT|nr:RdgB/HAM1 family non-canonical purine NTP pyrophosphatase [Chitinophaga terrae (ex Kim and Jung 2007)]MDQ0105921.1 XTP/dITP diphosphohydrolase [Chitinophaga terrae (ex Kim and Jung 2007)]GEP90148.1 non-canonical purine NTP pyrophosphatase [Chitinophaga terrae (ex Kim and Jung 2007)]SEA33172.1 XTP/dITP diphosphohydrolase [Chitinophaga terrae (ex Kim and Jung 2007)]